MGLNPFVLEIVFRQMASVLIETGNLSEFDSKYVYILHSHK